MTRAVKSATRRASGRASSASHEPKEPTRERVLDAALELFHARGFDATTMRDVAAAAGLSLGAAYYYFPSKEAIVLAYYVRQADAHESVVARAESAARASGVDLDLRARLAAIFHGKLDLSKRDLRLFGALFRSVGAPEDAASVFGPATRDVRERGVEMFRRALVDTPIDDAAREVVAYALWSLLLAVLLYFIHDASPGARRTRARGDDARDLASNGVLLSSTPMAAPLLAHLVAVLARAGLVGASAKP